MKKPILFLRKKYFLGIVALLLSSPIFAASTGGHDGAQQLYLKSLIYESQGNLAMALEHAKKALELTPDSSFLNRTAADYSFRMGLLPSAGEYAEKALELEPDDVKTLILAGQIYWAMGNTTLAEARLKKAVDLAPDEAEPLINLAMAVTPKEPRRAIELYEDYLDRHPGEVGIQERVAQLYQGLGEIDKAKKSWDRVLEWDPSSLRAHLSLAQIAEVRSDTSTAVGHYNEVLAQDPTNLSLLLRIGELQYRSNEMSEAFKAFSKAQSIAPNSASANFWLALLNEHRGEWDKAIELLEQVAERSQDPGILLRLSYYYSQAGRHKEGIEILKKLVEEDPENTDFLNYLAVAYEETGDYKDAAKVVQRLKILQPEAPEVYFHLATIYDQMKKFEDAEAALLKAIELNPKFHVALNYLGYSYADRNINLDKAEELMNTAIALNPSNGAYLDSMGWVYYRMKKFDKAEDFLLESIRQSEDPLIFEHLGQVFEAQKRYRMAILAYRESLRMDPTQKGVLKRIKNAMKKLSPSETLRLFMEQYERNFKWLNLMAGLTDIQVCQGIPCFKNRAEFSFDGDKEMTASIPGPFGGPVMLLVKSPGKAAEFGAVHPQFQSAEFAVKKVFEKIYSLLNGQIISNLDHEELLERVETKGREIRSKSGNAEIVFDSRTGYLKRIEWLDESGPETFRIGKAGKKNIFYYPEEIEWHDEGVNVKVILNWLKPNVSFNTDTPIRFDEE